MYHQMWERPDPGTKTFGLIYPSCSHTLPLALTNISRIFPKYQKHHSLLKKDSHLYRESSRMIKTHKMKYFLLELQIYDMSSDFC